MAIPFKRSLFIPSSFRPLTHKNFALFWMGAFLSSIGFWIQSVGQGWQVLQLSNSPLLLGLVSFAGLAPNMILSLFGGVIVDRVNRRVVLLTTQAIFMSTSLILGILTTLGLIQVWHIIALALVNGIFNSVGIPAWQTFIGDLLPERELKQGIALNSTQFNLSRVIGPALGGLSVGLVGIAGSYYLNALSYVGVLIPLFLVRTEWRKTTAKEQQGVWQELYEGVKYVKEHTVLVILLLLLFVFTFFVFPYQTLLPVFAQDVFHSGPEGLGLMNVIAGVGALVGSLLSVFFSQHFKDGQRILILLCLAGGVACVCFAFCDWMFGLALPFLFVLGVSTVMAMVITNSVFQTLVPVEMRGRVVSLWVLVSSGVAPLGTLASGWVAQVYGAPLTLAVSGTICVLLVVLVIIGVQMPLRSSHRLKAAKAV